MPQIIIPANNWRPRPYQTKCWNALEDGKKRVIEIAHRRWGKDELALNWGAVSAMTRAGGYWHMLPEYAQARKAIWTAVNPHTGKRRIDEAFPHEIRENTNEQEMFIRFKTGSTWQVIGSDNYDRLVGVSIAGITFSEWALANPSAWAYLAPVVAENNGYGIFITTPRGRNHAKSMYDMAKTNPSWFAEVSTVADTKAISLEIVEAQRQEYHAIYGMEAGDALIEQEFYCSFEAAILGAYWSKELTQCAYEGRITAVPPTEGVPVHTAWDLGVGDSMAIWFWQAVPGARGKGQINIVDYYQSHGYGIGHYATIIKQKARDRDYKCGIDFVPHDARVREQGSWGPDGRAKQRLEVMKECGLNPKIVKDHKLMDGLSAGRQILHRCHFDEKRCEEGLEALRQYRAEWDDDKKTFRDQPLHDWTSHPSDAFRYLAMAYREIVPEPEKAADRFLAVGPANQVTLNDLWDMRKRAPKRI